MTEKVAITSWNAIVSPLFDAAGTFLIVGSDSSSKTVDVRNFSLQEKADRCSRDGVQVVICGAVSNIAQALLQDRNIEVIPWVCGPVENIIEAYRANVNIAEIYAMPGCRGITCPNRGRRFRKHRNRLRKQLNF